jgi:hypothetical protein
MAEIEGQVCPVCKVKIVPALGGDRVMFAVGPQGSRETLWKKVCQYTKNSACINQDPSSSSRRPSL